MCVCLIILISDLSCQYLDGVCVCSDWQFIFGSLCVLDHSHSWPAICIWQLFGHSDWLFQLPLASSLHGRQCMCCVVCVCDHSDWRFASGSLVCSVFVHSDQRFACGSLVGRECTCMCSCVCVFDHFDRWFASRQSGRQCVCSLWPAIHLWQSGRQRVYMYVCVCACVSVCVCVFDHSDRRFISVRQSGRQCVCSLWLVIHL